MGDVIDVLSVCLVIALRRTISRPVAANARKTVVYASTANVCSSAETSIFSMATIQYCCLCLNVFVYSTAVVYGHKMRMGLNRHVFVYNMCDASMSCCDSNSLGNNLQQYHVYNLT